MKKIFYIYFFIFLMVNATDLEKLRDPFQVPTKQKALTKKPVSYTLEGIVKIGRKRCAVLVCGTRREILERGARFKKSVLEEIGPDFVVLVSGKKKLKLSLE